MKYLRFIVAALAAVALTLGLTAAPAQAVIPTDGTTVNADGSITQVKSAIDGGGIKHTFKVVWVKKYKDPVGTIRVSVPTLTVYRSDAATEAGGESADAGEDFHFDVSSYGTVRWTQHRYLDGADLDFATDDQLTVNPRNPVSDVGDTFIRAQAGVDGDGAPNSPFVYFVQPEGLPGPAVS